MPSFTTFAVLFTAITGALAYPIHYTRADNGCPGERTPEGLAAQWKSLLAKDGLYQPNEVLASNYKEYSASYLSLNNLCSQSESISTAPPYSRAVFTDLTSYQTAFNSDSRARWTFKDASTAIDSSKHDHDKIALRGSLTLVDDNTPIPVIAFLETTVEGTCPKLSSVSWEFDDTQAETILRQKSQCKGNSGNRSLPAMVRRRR